MTGDFTRVVTATVTAFCKEIHKAVALHHAPTEDIFRERKLEQTELVTLHFLNGISDIVQVGIV